MTNDSNASASNKRPQPLLRVGACIIVGVLLLAVGLCASDNFSAGSVSKFFEQAFPGAQKQQFVGMGVACMKRGDYKEAVRNFSEAIELGAIDGTGPLSGEPYYLRAQAYEAMGKQKLAQKDYATAKEHGYEP